MVFLLKTIINSIIIINILNKTFKLRYICLNVGIPTYTYISLLEDNSTNNNNNNNNIVVHKYLSILRPQRAFKILIYMRICIYVTYVYTNK